MSNGIVVDHQESGVRYAISEHNFNPKLHKKVRDLKPGETVRAFTPKRVSPKGGEVPAEGTALALPVTPDPTDVASTGTPVDLDEVDYPLTTSTDNTEAPKPGAKASK